MTWAQKMDIAGLAISLMTPVILVGVGYLLNQRIKSFETRVSEQRRMSETRLDLYREIALKLNDIYAYFLFVGNWKESAPDTIIAHKRELDRHVYAYRPIFSPEFFRSYNDFMSAAFRMFTGTGADAKLRTNIAIRPERDKPGYPDKFTGEDNRAEITSTYDVLLDCLAADLGIASRKKEMHA